MRNKRCVNALKLGSLSPGEYHRSRGGGGGIKDPDASTQVLLNETYPKSSFLQDKWCFLPRWWPASLWGVHLQPKFEVPEPQWHKSLPWRRDAALPSLEPPSVQHREFTVSLPALIWFQKGLCIFFYLSTFILFSVLHMQPWPSCEPENWRRELTFLNQYKPFGKRFASLQLS